MAETVIVTLQAGEEFHGDYELPANVPLRDLYPRLLKVLQKTKEKFFWDYSAIVLELDGAGLLDESTTLLDYGVSTGSYLEVAKKEKYDGFDTNQVR